MHAALCLGIESRFKGQHLHSREYRDVQVFRGKRVLVVGIGNTGGDLSVELSRVAAKVQLYGGPDRDHESQWLRVPQGSLPFQLRAIEEALQLLEFGPPED